MQDIETGVALWRRVADGIERDIAAGHHPPGARLPAESEIAETYRVNRHTVRRALAMLAERGLVRAERGSGTYVESARLAYPLRDRTRFSEIVGAGGREPRGRLLGAHREEASAVLARQLRLKAGSSLIRIDALRLADRTPLCIGSTWLSAERFPDAGELYGRLRSITRVLAHYGIRDYRRGSTRVRATIVGAGDAVHLQLAFGQPVLVVDSVDVDLEKHPLITTRARFAAERVEFMIETG